MYFSYYFGNAGSLNEIRYLTVILYEHENMSKKRYFKFGLKRNRNATEDLKTKRRL